jgi:hypothetical protein
MVLSQDPTARNLDLCLPSGTGAMARHATSPDMWKLILYYCNSRGLNPDHTDVPRDRSLDQVAQPYMSSRVPPLRATVCNTTLESQSPAQVGTHYFNNHNHGLISTSQTSFEI